MKKAIKIILSIIAAFFVVAGVWAMSAIKHVSPKAYATYYYEYGLNTRDLNQYQDPNNWTQITDPDEPQCSGGEAPCVVESTQSSVSSFVGSITTTADVENHAIRTKAAAETK